MDDNLRPATERQNAMNRRRRSDNTSGIKGVTWHKQSQRWRARTTTPEGRRIHVGTFIDLHDAEAAVTAARTRLHAEYTCHG